LPSRACRLNIAGVPAPPKDPLTLVNDSGFPFQMRVAAEVDSSPPSHLLWRLAAEEHAWSAAGGDGGFIDIIATGEGGHRLVIECKRAAEETWAFLTSVDGKQVDHVRALCTARREGQEDHLSLWVDLWASLPSWEAAFCVVKGKGGNVPMLERIAATLVQSADALAEEELQIGRGRPGVRIYIPIIVTAAKLCVSRFDRRAARLEDGRLSDEAAKFEEVPLVRFKKAFASKHDSTVATLEEAQMAGQQTVIVVNATALRWFLAEWFTKSPDDALRQAIRRGVRQAENDGTT